MRIKLFLLLSAAAVCAQAQTGLPNTEISDTVITSHSMSFDKNTRRLVYSDHVLVTDPKVKLWCEQLTLDLPPQGRPTNVVAETNVVIDFIRDDGGTNHVASDKAIYSFSVEDGKTNELVTFTGHEGKPPVVNSAEATIYSDPLIWDRAANKFHFTNETVHLKQSITGTNDSPFNFQK